MTRYLVVYYSRTGNTAVVAQAIADGLGADMEEITEFGRRVGPLSHLSAMIDAVREQSTEIRPSTRSVADYDVVVLGSPVWAWNMASPVRSYIMRKRASIASLALFCTQRREEDPRALRRMEELSRRASMSDLVIGKKMLDLDRWLPLVERFVHEFRRQAQPAPAPMRADRVEMLLGERLVSQ